jgi:tight adherence protein B
MSPALILLGIFLGLFIGTASLFYLLFEGRRGRKEMGRRMETIRRAAGEGGEEGRGKSAYLSDIDEYMGRWPLARDLQLFLTQAGSEWTPATLLAACLALVVVSFFIGFVLGFPALILVTMTGLAAGAPFAVLYYKRYRRFSRFERQFPEALDIMARAVRAGYAFTTGLQLIADEMPDPISREFRRTFEQQNLGLPLRDAFFNLSLRMPLPDVRIFVSTMQIQSETGGNLAETLDNLARIVRERFRLLRQVRTYTAEGRLSLYILTAMPPVMVVLLYLLNPRYIQRLLDDPAGPHLIGGAIILQLIGYLVIRKIVNIKV